MEWGGIGWNGNGMEWNGIGWDGMRWDGMEWDGVGWDGMGWNRMEWDGMEWHGIGMGWMEWDGIGWNGKGWCTKLSNVRHINLVVIESQSHRPPRSQTLRSPTGSPQPPMCDVRRLAWTSRRATSVQQP